MSDYVGRLWLIGAGAMAIEYSRILSFMQIPFQVYGRGKTSAAHFTRMTHKEVHTGGLDVYLNVENKGLPQYAIVAVNVEELEQVAQKLIARGIPNILLEKPGGVNRESMQRIEAAAGAKGVHVYVAYNRRYLSTVMKAREWIAADGGLTSFHFEFTEKADVIADLDTSAFVKSNWVIANSSHVIDLAFFVGGVPIQMDCYTASGLDWHRHAAVFAGAGLTKDDVLFTYKADWKSAGNWQIEWLTAKRRIYLNPLEQLSVSDKKKRILRRVNLSDRWDTQFKPGLYRLVMDFLSHKPSKQLVTMQEQVWNTNHLYVPIQQKGSHE